MMKQFFSNSKKYVLEEINSTNAFAQDLPADIPEGTVVIAKNQISGRGQGNNSWESDAGKNLTFSILIHPVFLKAVSQFYISKIVSLAVADFIALYTNKVTIKWPNDIYINNKKVAGILIENSIERDFIKTSIIGIGININQSKFNSGAPNPISIHMITGDTYDLEEMLDIFMGIFEYRYSMLIDKDFDTINQNYTDILYKGGVSSCFIAEGITFKGTILGIEETGELLIKEENGTIRKFLHKEVEFVLT